jgi:hypothetical protein
MLFQPNYFFMMMIQKMPYLCNKLDDALLSFEYFSYVGIYMILEKEMEGKLINSQSNTYSFIKGSW